jgi:hypothetical protein
MTQGEFSLRGTLKDVKCKGEIADVLIELKLELPFQQVGEGPIDVTGLAALVGRMVTVRLAHDLPDLPLFPTKVEIS